MSAGLIVSPLLMVVALTGGIYIFAAEATDVANQELRFVDSTGELVPFSSLITSAETAIPGGKATRITTFADPWRTATVSVKPPAQQVDEDAGPRRDRETTIFIDPYTSQVQEISDGAQKLEGFFWTMLKIHCLYCTCRFTVYRTVDVVEMPPTRSNGLSSQSSA